MPSSDATVSLRAAHGKRDELVAAVVSLLLGQEPALAWCEPRPTRERVDGFQTLWTAPFKDLRPFLNNALVLEEARLFWEAGSVHLVAGRSGSRWAAFWNSPLDSTPVWLQPLSPQGPELLKGLSRTETDVLTQRDWRRYGLKPPGTEFPKEKLKLTAYRQGTDLIFWHLSEGKARE
jgi:hypothetical protein